MLWEKTFSRHDRSNKKQNHTIQYNIQTGFAREFPIEFPIRKVPWPIKNRLTTSKFNGPKKIAKSVPEMQGNAREGDLVERDFSPHTLPHMRQKSVGSPPSTRAFPRSIRPGISRDISHFRVFCSVSSLSPCTSKRRTFCTRKRHLLIPCIRILCPLPQHNLSPQSHHIFSQNTSSVLTSTCIFSLHTEIRDATVLSVLLSVKFVSDLAPVIP